MMSNSMQRSSCSAYTLYSKRMWTALYSLLTIAVQNADRLFVNVKEHNADVQFRVCTSVLPAENFGMCLHLELVSSLPSG